MTANEGDAPTDPVPARVIQVVCSATGVMSVGEHPGSSGMGLANSFALFQQMAAELRAPGDDRPLVIEVRVGADGQLQMDHSFDLSSISPCALVLDPEYRYPNHPLPGMARPAGLDPGSRPADPEVLRHVGRLIDEFTDHYRKIKKRDPEFGRTSTEEELAAAEQAMGVRLPDDVRAIHLLAGDDPNEVGLLGDLSLYPLRQVVDRYHDGSPGCWGHDDAYDSVGRVVFETAPFGTVRRVSRNDWWVVVGSNNGGHEYAVDLDPGPNGRSGQLLVAGRGITGPVVRSAGSVLEQLTSVVEALRRGDIDPDHDGDSHLGVMLPDSGPPPHWASVQVGAQDLAAVLTADRTTVQQLYLNDAESLDLRALAGNPHVRELSVNRAGTVTGPLPPQLEALSLEARQADLSMVERHPTLWELELKGMPVAVAPLATLPALARLDLSEATVDNVEALAELDIRVLVLNGEQWRRVRASGRLPQRLAVAIRTGHTTLAEATDWAAWIRSHGQAPLTR